MSDVEKRLEVLERHRFKTLGRINALETLVNELWLDFAGRSNLDRAEFIRGVRQVYLDRADAPQRHFVGVDPAELDLIGQEYREALFQILANLERIASAEPKSGRQPKA